MTPNQITFNFDNSYSRLPDIFYENVNPQPVKQPQLITFNQALGHSLGIQNLESNELLAETFSGNFIPNGSSPIALAYAGHQFGHFVNQLGDGRAVLLGEVINGENERFDIQLKGSGKTKFSRQGDGRSALGPVIREYILSEAMHALNVPTTRALAAVTSGEDVYRETPLPGGVFTRVAKSHIRIGTFEYFIAQNDHQNLKILSDDEVKYEVTKSLEVLENLINRKVKHFAYPFGGKDQVSTREYNVIEDMNFDSAVIGSVYPIKDCNFFSLPRIYVGKNTCEKTLINHLSGFYNLASKLIN